jgi:hypothetical protein
MASPACLRRRAMSEYWLLASNITKLLVDRDLWHFMSREGIERTRRLFNLRAQATRLSLIYADLLARQCVPHHLYDRPSS